MVGRLCGVVAKKSLLATYQVIDSRNILWPLSLVMCIRVHHFFAFRENAQGQSLHDKSVCMEDRLGPSTDVFNKDELVVLPTETEAPCQLLASKRFTK